jgi:hypothetical protein
MFITGDKLFSGVNDTGKKFIAGIINLCHGFSVIAGVVDTGEQFTTPAITLPPGTTSSAINLLPVTRTRTPWSGGAAKVEGYKSAISPAADGVIGTVMKSCIHKHPTHLDQRPLRPPN